MNYSPENYKRTFAGDLSRNPLVRSVALSILHVFVQEKSGLPLLQTNLRSILSKRQSGIFPKKSDSGTRHMARAVGFRPPGARFGVRVARGGAWPSKLACEKLRPAREVFVTSDHRGLARRVFGTYVGWSVLGKEENESRYWKKLKKKWGVTLFSHMPMLTRAQEKRKLEALLGLP